MRSRTMVVGGWLCASLLLLTRFIMPLGSWALGTPGATPENVPPSFILEPVEQDGAFISLDIAAGEEQSAAVRYGIAGDEPVQARTYAADVFTLVNGGFGVRAFDDPVTGATTWIDYSTQTVELLPDQSIERSFTVSVPEGTEPGQYMTAIVVQTAESFAIGDSQMLRQSIRRAIAVMITVPGPETPQFDIGDVSLHRTINVNNMVIELSNTGNVLLQPSGTVTVSDAAGKQIVLAPVEMGSVYAGTSTTLEFPIPVILPPGTYNITVELTDVASGTDASADLELQVSEGSDMATPAITPVTIGAIAIEPVKDGGGTLQMTNVQVEIHNTGGPLPAARVTLHVMRDGELVEDYLLSPSLALSGGITTIQQRYIPVEGWQAGTYSFAITLEAIDLSSGQTTLLGEQDAPDTIEVP